MVEATRTNTDTDALETLETVSMIEKGTEVRQHLENEQARYKTLLDGFEQVKRDTRIEYERKRGQLEGAEATVQTELIRVEEMIESLTKSE